MEPKACPETSVSNYRYTLRNISEEHSYRVLRGCSRKCQCVTRSMISEQQHTQNNLRKSRRGCSSLKVSYKHVRVLNYIIFLHW